jgi:nitrogen fixation-related uncharacterized protein
MTFHDLYIIIGIGGFFIFLGILSFLWWKKEENDYYSSITDHVDVREFVDHFPQRPEPTALKTGGKILIAVGVIVLLISLGFFLWGMSPAT